MEYKVGDRVRYIGREIQNSMKPNPCEDLMPGIEGTVVKISKDMIGLFPLVIAFDLHKEEEVFFKWWADHKKKDTERLENLRKNALAKLTAEERKILGLE